MDTSNTVNELLYPAITAQLVLPEVATQNSDPMPQLTDATASELATQNLDPTSEPLVPTQATLHAPTPLPLDPNHHIMKDHSLFGSEWKERAIIPLDNWRRRIDLKPSSPFQDRFDEIYSFVMQQFAPLIEFNKWLDDNGQGEWHKQLAISLAKLPLKAARNIVSMIFNIIDSIIYAAAHPLRSLNSAVKAIVNVTYELTKPENWTRLGAGMIGTNLGQAAIIQNPLSLVSVGIGAALMFAGITVGALKAALDTECGDKFTAAYNNLVMQLKSIPEPGLTGFLIGLILGAVQRYQDPSAEADARVRIDQARPAVDQFVATHNLPNYSSIGFAPNGDVIIHWKGDQLLNLKALAPDMFILNPADPISSFHVGVDSAKMVLTQWGPQVEVTHVYYNPSFGEQDFSVYRFAFDGRVLPDALLATP